MVRVPHILGVGVVVASMLGCSGPPQADAGAETESGDAAQSEAELGDGTGETGEIQDECLAFCQVETQCYPDPYFSYEDCLETCADEFAAADAAEGCPQALSDFYACVGDLSCAQRDVLWDDENGPCYENAVAFDELCSEALNCELFGGGAELGSYCTYQFDCYGSGKHRVECTAETGCTCSIDQVEVGSCDSLYPALCEPFDGTNPDQANSTIIERMNDCCGWALEI
jgi:hypothetical protein